MRAQLSGSAWSWALRALPFATLVAGCAQGNHASAGPGPDASPDAAAADAAAPDAPPDVAIDDAAPVPDVPGCAISAGVTPAIDGVDDLADYPADQRITPGAMLGADGAAIAWDRSQLYITVASAAFDGEYEPLHVYVEAGTALGEPAPSTGKEYSGLVPMLPFTPTHLIAARRTNGADDYDGIYLPAQGFTTRGPDLAPGAAVFAAADNHALSVVVPWSALGGCPTALRMAIHVVHGAAANEWKDLVPATHTPWLAPGGGYYEIDLTGAGAVSGWTLR